MKNFKLLFVLIMLLGLSACDNDDDIGEEIEDVGEAIEDAAE